MDFYGFYTGTEFQAYEYLGAHYHNGKTIFRTFAPAALEISVIGEFNNWTETPMHKTFDSNFWECEIDGTKPEQMYKYRIYKRNGKVIDHCDPYGYYSELRPANASRIYDLSQFKFTDEKWIYNREDYGNKPLNIYELHFGSWKKKSDKAEDWYTYSELADLLIPYLKENKYNFIEIMPLNEHPCDESWGYQSTGFFAATSRYGTPDELRKFINKCHLNGIGVIMDFVPVHFAVDDYALWNYDGTSLYEYPNNDVGRSEWGSCNFMHSRGEVRSFLQSAAHFWINKFHFDGLRMDAVSNLIYWQGDPARGENKMTMDFIRTMNSGLKREFPNCILIAEDSSSYIGVTKPVQDGGLGFDFKWDLGWMNDTLNYFRTPPEQRSQNYHMLTFSMMYFYNEKYLLPLSHDEVVHGKATIIQKMYGDYDIKFPQARALYLYMMCHPGKKLNFMGNEIGQFREWDEKREQDWNLLDYPIHKAFHEYIIKLNEIYRECPSLYELDYSPEGFEWIDCHSEDKCIYAFIRKSGTQQTIAVFNFSDKETDYTLNIGDTKEFKLIIDSNAIEFGGYGGSYNSETAKDGKINIKLSPFSGRLYLV